jgi:hypothetical protein
VKGREGKGREGKGREGKGREGKGRSLGDADDSTVASNKQVLSYVSVNPTKFSWGVLCIKEGLDPSEF